ncbi:Fe2+-dependent dioxygenase [Hypericibacter sp.]|uniref:Fe2+-dependent dioxygenase n=1 Tax=Hypericibacter sp. TaxID=2705401 RepID=UPI003D6D49C3
MIYLIPNIMTAAEVVELTKLVAESSFEDGVATAGSQARRVKKNEQLARTDKNKPEVQKRVREMLLRSIEFKRATLPKHIRPCLISRYRPGMHYGPHVDNGVMGSDSPVRSDIAVTLFLCEPDDYDGGELVIHTNFGPQQVKLPMGSAVVYPASSLHEVAPLTRGERLCAVTWIQSLVRDPARREVLYELDLVRRKLHEKQPDAEETYLVQKNHANLIRMWADT